MFQEMKARLIVILLLVLLFFSFFHRLSKEKRIAAGDRPILFKSVFDPPNMTKYNSVKLPVKVYRGNCETDDPEFEEFRQEEMSLSEFVNANSPFRQIKLAFPCDELPMGRELDQFAREVEKKFTFVSKQLRQFRNFRISTQSWRFPQHLDPGNQLVLHLSGTKRWWLKNPQGAEEEYVCRPGDVLYVPIGRPHRTENLSPMCCITNIGWSYVTDNYPYYERLTRALYPIRADNVDNRRDYYHKKGSE